MQSFATGASGFFGGGLGLSGSPVNDAAAWMQNRLDGRHHPALDTDNPSAFIKTVDSYNVDARRYGSMEMDLLKEHTWDGVLSVQQHISQERDVQTSKGFRGSLHKRLRQFFDHSESFQSWLKLLPAGSQYLSILCGGLTLVLGAAQRMSEIRDSIFDVVDVIPLTLSKAKQYLNIFPDYSKLHECSADLYVAILDTLDAIVRHYQKHVARRLSSALFKQNMSGQELQDKIKLINECASQLTTQAQIASMQRQQDMHEGDKDRDKFMIASARLQDYGFNTIVLHQHDMSEGLQRQARKLESLAEALNQTLGLLKASPSPPAGEIRAGKLLEPENPAMGLRNRSSRSPSPGRAGEPDETRKLLKTLLGKLDIGGKIDIASTDTVIQLRLIHTLTLPSQDRAVALIMSPRLQTWLTSTSSSMILVNGQMFSNEDEARQSPLSYFCAKLIDSVLNGPRRSDIEASYQHFVVRWFCGLHTNVLTDADAHPSGMLYSIVSQLLHQVLDFLPQLALEDASVLDKDLDRIFLNDIFDRLVRALPAGTILFCVIDGISYYEDPEREEECLEVLSMLTNLIRRCREMMKGPTVKLLITAPLRSHLVHRLLEEDEILNMNVTYPSNGGFSALQWDLGMSRLNEQ
ncbi:MAG: hypothetical protein Q9208_000337 [Pyrenodesmia sp. 3 TL-2023]